ncbi:MAG: phosphatase PAP2 family protein [Albidovulum sp.]
MRHSKFTRQGGFLAAGFAALMLVFTVWPGIDLWVTAQFYRPGQGFWLAGAPWLGSFRHAVWDLSIVMLVASLIGLVMALVKRPLLRIGAKSWGFVVLLYVLAPGVLVNGLLKSYWGRARPADVGDFGGVGIFTPPWLPADQCASNCSFVSGEVSATMALAVAVLLIIRLKRHDWPGWLRKPVIVLALVLPLAVSAQRIATGRHFLSDALFAMLFTLAVAWVLAALINRNPPRPD